MQKFWRTDCSFTYKNNVRVEHRIHTELAETAEEAAAKTRSFLEFYSDYSEITINEVHEETEDEKYRRVPVKKFGQKENEISEPPKPAEISVTSDGDLF